MRLALICGEGQEHQLQYVKWPKEIKCEVFPFNFPGIARASRMICSGSFAHVIIAVKEPSPELIRQLPKDKAKVHYWPGSVIELNKKIYDVLGLSKPTLEPIEATAHQRPFVSVTKATAFPERRPSWSDDENMALSLAYDESFSLPKFVDTYLDLTKNLDAPARSQPELRAQLERMKKQREEDVDRAAPADALFDLIYLCSLILTVKSLVSRLKRAREILNDDCAETNVVDELNGRGVRMLA